MSIRRIFAAISLVGMIAAPSMFSQVAYATTSDRTPDPVVCVVVQGSRWTVNEPDQTITANFVVKGDKDCKHDVSVMSWTADASLHPKPEFWTTQKIHKVTTATLPVGSHNLTVALPVCATDPKIIAGYQADVIASANPSPVLLPPNTPGSFYDKRQSNGKSIVVDAKVYPKVCPAAPTPVTPVTPAATVTPVTPTVLPNAGAGDVFAIGAASALVAAFAHRVYTRRKLTA